MVRFRSLVPQFRGKSKSRDTLEVTFNSLCGEIISSTFKFLGCDNEMINQDIQIAIGLF